MNLETAPLAPLPVYEGLLPVETLLKFSGIVLFLSRSALYPFIVTFAPFFDLLPSSPRIRMSVEYFISCFWPYFVGEINDYCTTAEIFLMSMNNQ